MLQIWVCDFFLFFFISNKDILKRRRVSPEYTGSIHQGKKQIKCIKYKSPWNHGLKKKNKFAYTTFLVKLLSPNASSTRKSSYIYIYVLSIYVKYRWCLWIKILSIFSIKACCSYYSFSLFLLCFLLLFLVVLFMGVVHPAQDIINFSLFLPP